MNASDDIKRVVRDKQRIIDLNNYLERENFKYHTLGKPEISDSEYDSLYSELTKLEEEHPLFRVPGGITSKVGAVVLPSLTKAKHSSPLLSLKKVHTVQDVVEFVETIKGTVIANGKLDGLALDLIYVDQRLFQAITRGDGETGEDVTEVVKTIRNVPKVLPTYAPMGTIEVRGEVILPIKAFEKMNDKLKEEGKETYSNPRNAVSGILRSLDMGDVTNKPLAFFAYGIGRWDETYSKPINFHSAMSELVNFGFSHKRYHVLNATRNVKETEDWVNRIVNQFTELRPNYDIEIDGIVFGADSFITREEMGTTSQYPKHSIAYKFPASIGTSSLIYVEWQVGRTGVLTPVAMIEPVEVHGVTISRVTLHNPAEIDRLGIMVGDKISVSRQGDVIPKISKVFTELRDDRVQEIILPSECPVCSSTTVLNEDGNFLFCTGANVCGGRRITTIEHFASREAMNIKGLGLNTIRLFVEKGFLSDISDIYRLHEFKDKLYDLDGFGSKSVDELLDRIEKSKQTDLHRFIYSIGINGVGISTAKNLVKYFNNDLENIMGASPSMLEEIEDIGSITAELIYIYFQTTDNLSIVHRLLDQGIQFNKIEENEKVQYFKDQTWVVTGSFDFATRSEWEAILKERGATITGSVSSKTDCILVENSLHESSKMTKARELNVRIVQERELAEMIKEANELGWSKITFF